MKKFFFFSNDLHIGYNKENGTTQTLPNFNSLIGVILLKKGCYGYLKQFQKKSTGTIKFLGFRQIKKGVRTRYKITVEELK